MKRNLIKVLLLAFVALGLAACSGTVVKQDSPTQTTVAEHGAAGTSGESAQFDLSVFDDFPEWWRDSMTEAEKEMLLDVMTPERLAAFREQVEEREPSMMEGSQIMLVPPGGGPFEMTEEGLIQVGEDADINTNERGLPQEQLFGVIQAIEGMKITIDTSQVMGFSGGDHFFSGESVDVEEEQKTIIRLKEQITIEVRTAAGGQVTGTRAGTLDDLTLQAVAIVDGEWQGEEFVATKLTIFQM